METVPEQSIDDRLRGMEYNIQNNMALSSLPALRELYETQPDHPQINYLLALHAFKNHDYKKAYDYIAVAIQSRDNEAKYHILLAKLNVRERNTKEAKRHAERALTLEETNWEAAKILAELEYDSNQLDEAKRLNELVLAAQPKLYAALRLKTKLLLQQEAPLAEILQSLDESEKYGYDDELAYDRVYAHSIHGDMETCRAMYEDLKRTRPLSHSTTKVAALMDRIDRRNVRANPLAAYGIENRNKKERLSVEEAMRQLDGLVGLQEVKDAMQRIVKLDAYNKRRSYLLSMDRVDEASYHFAFTGNPGTGKTTVARIVADIFYALGMLKTGQLIEVDRSDLVGSYMGQTAQKTREVIESARGGVLFIDEATALIPGKNDRSDYAAEAIDVLVKAMEDQRGDFIVILAGYEAGMKELLNANPGLSSRINLQIGFEDFSDEELLAIAKEQAKQQHYTLTEQAEKAFLVRMNEEKVSPQFANARAVRNVMEAAMRERAFRLSDRPVTEEELQILEAYDFGIDPAQLFAEDYPTLLEELAQLVGMTEVKKQVKAIANYVRAEKRREEQGHPTSELSLHMVFTGNPGTGKTTIARLISKLFKAIGILKRGHMIEVTRDDLVGQYVGQTGPKTLEKIQEAYGGVLFIDEAYSLFSGSESDYGQEAVSTLIKEMEDNRGKLVVIMAGYPHEMDRMLSMNAGIRSRVAFTIDFPDYSAEELTSIFEQTAHQQRFTLEAEAIEAVRQMFEEGIAKRDRHFGNARDARSLFERTKLQQSNRLAEDEEADLFILTKEDIEAAL